MASSQYFLRIDSSKVRVGTLKGQMLFRKLVPVYLAPTINVNAGIAASFSLSLINSVVYFIFVERVIRDYFQIFKLAYLLRTIVGTYTLNVDFVSQNR